MSWITGSLVLGRLGAGTEVPVAKHGKLPARDGNPGNYTAIWLGRSRQRALDTGIMLSDVFQRNRAVRFMVWQDHSACFGVDMHWYYSPADPYFEGMDTRQIADVSIRGMDRYWRQRDGGSEDGGEQITLATLLELANGRSDAERVVPSKTAVGEETSLDDLADSYDDHPSIYTWDDHQAIRRVHVGWDRSRALKSAQILEVAFRGNRNVRFTAHGSGICWNHGRLSLLPKEENGPPSNDLYVVEMCVRNRSAMFGDMDGRDLPNLAETIVRIHWQEIDKGVVEPVIPAYLQRFLDSACRSSSLCPTASPHISPAALRDFTTSWRIPSVRRLMPLASQ
jgi:hypothetical protein